MSQNVALEISFFDPKAITGLQSTAIHHFAIEFVNLSEVDLGHVHMFCLCYLLTTG